MGIIAAAWIYYQRLPHWVQLVMQWAVRAGIASFILAQWSSVATYWYALRYGARPPVEGVPFLALTVALLGLILLLLTTLLFYGLPYLLRTTRAMLVSIASHHPMAGSKHKYKLIFFACLTILFASATLFLSGPYRITLQVITIVVAPPDREYLGVVLALFFFIAIYFLAILLPKLLGEKSIFRLTFGLYSFAILLLMIAMLGTPFDHVLRATRFGGGLQIDIELPNKERLPNQSLFLTSTNFVTVYDPNTMKFREVNREHVVQIEYGGVNGWSLPKQRRFTEIFGFDDLARGATATAATP